MFFQRLEDLGIDNDETQQNIADLLNCKREVYRRYEKGIHEIPVWAVLKLAKHYGTNIDYILGNTDFKEAYPNFVEDFMPKSTDKNGQKNLIGSRLKELRINSSPKMSQRALSHKLQLMGVDMDRNVITRIETNKRYVTDIEVRALAKIFNVSYEYLIDGIEISK